MSLYFTYMVPEVVTAICERPYCIMTLIFKNRSIWAIRGGLHKDIAQCKSRVPVARWMVKREGKAAQRDYSKKRWIEVVSREQTFPSSKHATQHPSAHPEASLTSITPSRHRPPAFILPPVTPIPFSLTCRGKECRWDSAVS